MITLPDDWMESEKGNTLLSNDDGALVAWIQKGDRCLEISYTPGNNPAFYVSECAYDPVRIGQHVVENLGGWFCHRWNLSDDAPIDSCGYIEGED